MFSISSPMSLAVLRVVWLLAPLLAGPALADALADRSRAVQLVASAGLWVGWAAGLAAVAVPRAATLTVLRLVAPGFPVVAVWALLDAPRPGWAVTGLTTAVVAAGVALLGPGVSDAFVDGSSYGAERRAALRIPGSVLLGVVPLAWAAAAAGVTVGPLLLASERWVAGGVATTIGAVVVVVVATQFHQLSRRWLVFVPAGIVVHDPLRLSDPLLFLRRLLRSVAPADPSRDDALDLSGGALGLVVELRSREPLTAGVRVGRDLEEHGDVAAVWVSPVRPGAALELARDHRLPVGP